MTSESVPNATTSPAFQKPHRKDCISQHWEECGLPGNITHRLAAVNNAVHGLSGILRVLSTDENDAEEAESWAPEENFVHMPLSKQTRWELHKAAEVLLDMTHSRMEEIPEIVAKEKARDRFVDIPVFQPKAVA
ncbi:MAG TPA: hypothetical protein VNM48_01525 [Chloroflexota bacterium]|nr:hypothetical protein [Chloroflexota bacterium]